nr:MAG TPA: hypothetical protein [Caudoviricetes sp.]
MELQQFLSNYTVIIWLHRCFLLKKPSLKR